MAFPIGSIPQKLTIDSDLVEGSSNFTDVPVLVKSGDLTTHTYANMQGDGDDIRFTTDLEGENEIPFEIVSLDASEETCEIWVKLPTLYYNQDTIFYIWFGDPSLTAYDPDDTYGSQNVWPSKYSAVWHMEEAANTTRKDSTIHGLDLTDQTNVGRGVGKIGGGADFVRADADYMDRANSSYLNMGTGNFTVSALVKFDSASIGNTVTIVNMLDDSSNPHGNGYGWTFGKFSDNKLFFYMNGASTPPAQLLRATTTTIQADTWYHVAITRGGATDRKIYVNGVAESTSESVYSIGGNVDNIYRFNVGEYHGGSENIDGIIDELKIVKGYDLESNWIKTEANNLTNANFITGSDVAVPDANVNATVQSSTISLPSVGVTTVKNEEVSVGVQSSTVSQVDPSITAVKNTEILSNEVSLVIDQPAIDVEAAKNVSTEVVVQEIALTQNDPVVEADINALVNVGENNLSLTQNEASVETVKNTEVVLDEIDVNALLNSPDVSTTLGTPVTPDVIESTISVNSPTVQVSGKSNIRILINEEGELFFEMLQSAGGE